MEQTRHTQEDMHQQVNVPASLPRPISTHAFLHDSSTFTNQDLNQAQYTLQHRLPTSNVQQIHSPPFSPERLDLPQLVQNTGLKRKAGDDVEEMGSAEKRVRWGDMQRAGMQDEDSMGFGKFKPKRNADVEEMEESPRKRRIGLARGATQQVPARQSYDNLPLYDASPKYKKFLYESWDTPEDTEM